MAGIGYPRRNHAPPRSRPRPRSLPQIHLHRTHRESRPGRPSPPGRAVPPPLAQAGRMQHLRLDRSGSGSKYGNPRFAVTTGTRRQLRRIGRNCLGSKHGSLLPTSLLPVWHRQSRLNRRAPRSKREKSPSVMFVQVRRQIHRSGRSRRRSRRGRLSLVFHLTIQQPQPRPAGRNRLNGCPSRRRTRTSSGSPQRPRNSHPRRLPRDSRALQRNRAGGPL